MNFIFFHIRKFVLISIALTAMLSISSCQSSKKIMEEESLTGIYEVRSSGLFNKSFTFASSTIKDIKASGKPTKSVLRHEGASKTDVSMAMSFTMEDLSGFKWSGLGGVESVSVSLGKKEKSTNTLTYKFRLTEAQTGRVIRYEISFNALSEGFDGFMKGTVVDDAGTGLYEIISSQNLEYMVSPAEALSGFTIRRENEVLSSILKTKGNWSVTFNIAEDDPQRVEMSAILSSLFVLIEEGRI